MSFRDQNSIRRRLRLFRAAATSAAVAALAAGCTQVSAGSPTWNADEATVPVSERDVVDIVIDLDTLGEMMSGGGNLQETIAYDEPFEQSGYGTCDQLKASGLAGYLGDDWLDFRYLMASNQMQADGPRHTVVQSVAIYGEAPQAQAAYDDMNADNLDCDGTTFTTESAAWLMTVDDDADDGVALWTLEQTDSETDWRCAGRMETRNNALLRGIVCASGEGGQELVADVLGAMAAAVWERSGPS